MPTARRPGRPVAHETPPRTSLLLSALDRARADAISETRTGRPGLASGIRVALREAPLDGRPMPAPEEGARALVRLGLTEQERSRALALSGSAEQIGDGVRRALALVYERISSGK
jgi:hypothetical protein